MNKSLFLLLLICITPGILYAQKGKKLDYVTSWLGNSLPGSKGWVLQDVEDIFVTPDGTVYTNVPWDEHGGNVMSFKNGKFIREARVGNNGGGHTITANSRYIYFGGNKHRTGKQGIDRRDLLNIQDKSKNVHVDCGIVHGIVANDNRVYAAVPGENKVKIFDEELNFINEWNVEDPGEMAMDEEGTLWILHEHLRKVRRYDIKGNKLDQEIKLGKNVQPTDISFDNQGRLMISDEGVNQQVYFYRNLNKKPTFDKTYGVKGGVFAGDNPGEKGPLRLYHPKGIGMDTAGNIYVANKSDVNNNGSTLIQSYQPDGTLKWEMSASLWIDCVDAHPENNEILYGGGEKFVMDYSRPIGEEATLTAFTANPFDFPGDARIGGHKQGYQRGATWMRSIEGHTFMYLTSMNVLPISIYRFDHKNHGEIAIPCGKITGSELWIDHNGNGLEESDEIQLQDIGKGMGGWVDSEGTVWHCDRDGFDRMTIQGVNQHGVPVYTNQQTTSFPLPQNYTELRRIRFYPERNNMMILNGFTKNYPDISHHGKRAGKVWQRYDNWSPDRWEMVWELIPPFEDRKTGNFGDANIQAFALRDDYLFFAPNGSSEKMDIARGTVYVYNLHSTEMIGWMEPDPIIQEGDPNGGPYNIGIMDINNGMNVVKNNNGEYLIFWEDDWNTKNLMYRWCPNGNCR